MWIFYPSSSAHDPRVHNKVGGEMDRERGECHAGNTRLSRNWWGGESLWIFRHFIIFVPVSSCWEEEDVWLNLRGTVGSKRMQREESWDTPPLYPGLIPGGRVTYLGRAFLKQERLSGSWAIVKRPAPAKAGCTWVLGGKVIVFLVTKSS